MLNPAEVLAIHTEIMKCYDKYPWEEDSYYEDTEQGKLITLKTIIEKATIKTIPETACYNLKFLPNGANLEVNHAAPKAYNIAINAVKDIHTLNEFKSEFRKAYDAALRIALYDQFISKVVSIGDNTTTESEFISSVIKMMYADIKQFKSIASNFSKKDHSNFVKLKNEFNHYALEFRRACNSAHICNAALDFEKKAGKLIRSYQIQYEHELSWTPFLKNLLINLVLIATGVGALVSLGLLVYRGVSGRHAFFDQPMLIKRPTIAAEEKLLSPEDENPYSFFNEYLRESELAQLGEPDSNNLLRV